MFSFSKIKEGAENNDFALFSFYSFKNLSHFGKSRKSYFFFSFKLTYLHSSFNFKFGREFRHYSRGIFSGPFPGMFT